MDERKTSGTSLVERFSRLLSQKRKETSEILWQDREIRFDLATAELRPRLGEIVLASLENVEDAKGRQYEVGWLYVTNLRTIWTAARRKRLNLSIGHSCLVDFHFEEVASRVRGGLAVMRVATRFMNASFEFWFSSYEADARLLYNALEATAASYRKTRLYRDLAIRDLLTRGTTLLLLREEEVCDRLETVYNLVCKEANLGTLFVTNLRVVWNSSAAPDLNVSIPYLQFRSVKVRDSKFGKALVIETSEGSGGYVFGFGLEPLTELQRLQKEIASMHDAFHRDPVFGVNVATFPTEQNAPLEDAASEEREEERREKIDVLGMYCAFDDDATEQSPVYEATLGLAIEPLEDGVTLEDLWNAT